MNSSGETPKKISISSGCLICGTEQSDSRKKTSLKGKVSDLAGRVAAVLDIDPNTVDVERYLCNDRCYKRIKRLEKSQEEARLSKDELKANFASTNRVKRGVQSDSFLSPSTVAPTKSARRIDQSTSGPKKTLKFTTSEDVRGKSPLPDIMPLVGLPIPLPQLPQVIPAAFVPVAANILSQGNCEGNVCKVQVCT